MAQNANEMKPAPSRRGVLAALGGGAGLAVAGLPRWAGWGPPALAQGTSAEVITKAVAQTGEKVPAIGLGTYLTFDLLPGAKRDHLGEVVKRYWEGGARVVDTSPLYGTGEPAARMMLHAASLIVTRPGKTPITAHAPLPAPFHALGFGDG